MFPHVIDAINVPRPGTGRARTRPHAVMGDKAYSSRDNRSLLRARKIKAVIPEPRDQIANRKRKGARGSRPVDFDSEAYKGRSVVEQSFNIFKQWRSIATRYDKLAITYRSRVALYSRSHLATPIRRHATPRAHHTLTAGTEPEDGPPSAPGQDWNPNTLSSRYLNP